MQGRTHNCGELRLENAGQEVRLVGWYENIRKVSKNLGFLILRDFYGTTQIVVELSLIHILLIIWKLQSNQSKDIVSKN